MIPTSLSRQELGRVIDIFHRGYQWWKLAELFHSPVVAEITRSHFLACLEWCTRDAAPDLYNELRYVLKEVEKLLA
jgi:hypothetical protein